VGVWSKYKAHHKNPRAYLGFTGNDALLVGKGDAAGFRIEHGELKSEDYHIGSAKFRGAGVLQRKHRQTDKTEHEWKRIHSGDLELSSKEFSMGNGTAVLCATRDGSLFGQYTKEAGRDCKEVLLRAIDDGTSALL
jgi:hypothetical protein